MHIFHRLIDYNRLSLCCADVKNLIDHLLVTDRHKRLRAQEILLHPWIIAMGQTKTLRYTEELKSSLRSKYDAKILEYAAEGGAS